MNKHLDFLTNLCSTHLVVFAFKSSGVWRWEDGRGKAGSKNGRFKYPAAGVRRNQQVFQWRYWEWWKKRIVEVVVLPRFANNVEAEL